MQISRASKRRATLSIASLFKIKILHLGDVSYFWCPRMILFYFSLILVLFPCRCTRVQLANARTIASTIDLKKQHKKWNQHI